ncbi:MAG: hypothetical protein JWP74_744 [Marmoricola sp.]|nr:hypothetical protein [Marmoricola sp.]
MTFTADELEAEARTATGLEDFGDPYYREGLERLLDSINHEAELSEMGEMIQRATLVNHLSSRLSVEQTYRDHPEIDEEVVGGPVFVIGLPRTGTTALSQLVAADPQFRSLRTWESTAPTPPPEAATQHDDPRIARTAENLEMLNLTFPLFRAMYNVEPTAPTECQDLMGMSFRTVHYDGMVRCPSYTDWVVDCDMDQTYEYHRRVLKLLQWHCPPTLWHLKTPVHVFALPSLVKTYPDAKFLWSHRDPAPVLGSVCSLIHYVRSWGSDRDDAATLGEQQLALWVEGIGRAMAFRAEHGDDRFVDVAFSDLHRDPVGTLASAYEQLGLELSDASTTAIADWAEEHKPGGRGSHDYDLTAYGISETDVRERFSDYLAAFDASV